MFKDFMRNIIISFNFIAVIIIAALVTDSIAIPAFPGAEGFGADAVGGRGGTVIKVTSLADSGPGTLREAIDAAGPRIVVFDISGYIILDKSLEIRNPYITIAGQTAPGKGICIKNSYNSNQTPLEIYTHNIIIRYLRIRPGIGDPIFIPGKGNSKWGRYELDCISIYGADSTNACTDCHDIIIDHCSLSWGSDENLSIIALDGCPTNPRDISIQNCIISECLHRSSAPDGYASMCFIIAWGDVKNVSVHHNLFAHNDLRNPIIQSNGCVLDFVNNVIYNYGYHATMLSNLFVPDTNKFDNIVAW